MQRLINFTAYKEGASYWLRVTEYTTSTLRSNRSRLGQRLLAIQGIPNDDFEWFAIHYRLFNNALGDEQIREAFDKLHTEKLRMVFPDSLVKEMNLNCEYQCFKLTPTDDGLRFIGIVDSVVRTILHKKNHEIVGVQFQIGDAAFTPDENSCRSALTMKGSKPPRPATALSRSIVDWMLNDLEKREESEQYQVMINCYNRLLQDAAESLTSSIRMHLYPPTPTTVLIDELCKGADDLTRFLLNSEHSVPARDEALLAFIRTKLKTISGDNKPQVHAEIKQWFAQYEIHRAALWNALIARLIGYVANDGGPYNARYTEIVLLNQSRLEVNLNGLIELEFLQGEQYKNVYAENMVNYHLLEPELIDSCGDLGFAFTSEQGFHQKVLFDAKSTEKLKLMGFQYTEKYAKLLLKKELYKEAKAESPAHTTSLSFLAPFPPDVKRMIADWVHIATFQQEATPQAAMLKL